MIDMATKVQQLYPELVVTLVAFVVMILGLSKNEAMRRSTFVISAFGLLAAIFLAGASEAMGIEVNATAQFMKIAICGIGLVMLALMAEVPDEAGAELEVHTSAARFDPAHTSRGEFFGFLLLSLVGAMLCAGADDLIWLFLALELTSLPTYVLVTISRKDLRAPEAGVKYFFLGAMAAAIFLYGFALIYAATGTTYIHELKGHFAAQGMSPLAMTGVVVAIVGLCFKIAAVPMHIYVADVYQGAATPVSAFLAFVPKAAGFLGLIVVIDAIGWPGSLALGEGSSQDGIGALLWVIAAITMIAGNTLALLQTNVKRVLAYSSIAHSGYMLVGLVAGPGGAEAMGIRNGVAAVLFYLVAYGVMNVGAFAVLAMLKRRGEEAETYDDLRGLYRRRPGLAAVMAICVLSLTGIPPLVGFWGKAWIIGAAFSASAEMGPAMFTLGVIALVNSAIAAFYYLHIFGVCFLNEPTGESEPAELPARNLAAYASAIAVVVLSLAASPFLIAASNAAAPFAEGRDNPTIRTEAIPEPATPLADDESVTAAAARR